MIPYNIESAITLMVDKMLPRYSRKDLGLLFTVRLGNFLYGPVDLQEQASVQILFVRPSNYTKVFSRVLPADGTGEWEQTSDHDSCWREDGFSLLLKQASILWENLRKQAGRKLSPNEVHEYNTIENDVQYVEVEYCPVGSKENHTFQVDLRCQLSLAEVAPQLGKVKP